MKQEKKIEKSEEKNEFERKLTSYYNSNANFSFLSCDVSFVGTFENKGIKNPIIESLPLLKNQELMETSTTSLSIQVSLNDKHKDKERTLRAFEGKRDNSKTLFSLNEFEGNFSVSEIHSSFYRKCIFCDVIHIGCCIQALVEFTCTNHYDDFFEFIVTSVHTYDKFRGLKRDSFSNDLIL